MAIHPPLIYSGLVVFTVPFALVDRHAGRGTVLAVLAGRHAALGTRGVDLAHRRGPARRVVELPGARLGRLLGRGIPSRTPRCCRGSSGTAYVHSVVVEERRGLLRVWNLDPRDRGLRPHDPRHVLHALGRAPERARLQLVDARADSCSGSSALVLAAGLGLLAWRGDQLRSPVGIDAPLSREGAFVANNVLFVGFALVVLLGTVFPLGYQAIEHSTVTVGPPYFDSVAVPVRAVRALPDGDRAGPRLAPARSLGAVAPHARGRVGRRAARRRARRVDGVRGIGTLVAYLLAIVAAWTALRALAANARAARTRGAPLGTGSSARSSGGMVVHLGVVLATVAIVSSVSFSTHATVELAPGQTKSVGGHSLTYEAVQVVTSPVRTATELVVRVDDGGLFYPAISKYAGGAVQTPAIDSSLLGDDVYLTYVGVGSHGEVALSVTVERYVSWLWVGGLSAGLGGLLALARAPRRRRREPEAVVAAPIRELETV